MSKKIALYLKLIYCRKLNINDDWVLDQLDAMWYKMDILEQDEIRKNIAFFVKSGFLSMKEKNEL